MNIDAQELELQQNNSYRDNYRRLLTTVVVLVLIGVVLSAILIYQTMMPVRTKYFATTTTGVVVPLQSLRMPVVTNNYLLQWAGLATRTAYNLNFESYPQALKKASAYFTSNGWEAFMSALKQSGVIGSLENNKLFMSAVVNGPAVILDEEVIHGRYSWQVQLPLLVTYTSANEKRKAHFIVTMNILRVPVLNAEKGIQINSFVAVRK